MKWMRSLIFEYGIVWAVCRAVYTVKLYSIRKFHFAALLFEKKANIKRIDLFDIDTDKLREFLRSLPKEKQDGILAAADKAATGKLTAFSSIELDYGSPVNWQLNPITRKCADKTRQWYEIPDFDAEVGDIKIIWELSRFTHFFYFARAYLLTGNKKYYQYFSQHIMEWLDDNTYPLGANFKCGQECSLRMITALITASVFSADGLVTDRDEENLKKLIEICYRKILSNFFYAHRCIQNNHTLSEIAGLIAGAWCCDKQRELNHSYKLLEKAIKQQFTPDGGYCQFSFNYQRLALQIIGSILKMEQKTGISLTEKSKSILKNSIWCLYQMQIEDGSLPNYGPNDGALFFPLSVCDYRDFRPCLNSIYSQLTGMRLYAEDVYDEESYWFSRPRNFDETQKRRSMSFNDAGLYSLRNNEIFIMAVCQQYKSRPAHMDQLHIDLWYHGLNVFCDSGTYSYINELSAEIASTSGHNVIVADSREQMNKRKPFFIYDWTKRLEVCHNSNSFIGKFSSKNGYSHRRSITLLENSCEIVDEVSGAGTIARLFHTPCDVESIDDGFMLSYNGKNICMVKCTGDITVTKTKRSLYYMSAETINLVTVRTNGSERVSTAIQFI